jgi:hypothetical protein
MIEIRKAVTEWDEWLNDSIGYKKMSESKLQYRLKMAPNVLPSKGGMVWSDWIDVPTVYLDENGEEINENNS